MEFPQRLFQLRRQAGLSQEDLANQLNISRQAVQKWEAGTSRPDMDNLIALADTFHVTLDWLIRGTETPPEATQPAQAVQVVRETVIHHYHDGWHYEYRSKKTLFGLPLVHINLGRNVYIARGIFAIGNIAIGLVSMGAISLGLCSLGAISIALLALGALTMGLVSIGAVSLGYLCLGGIALGVYAVGGVAAALNVAIGGIAKGSLSIGNVVPQTANAFSLTADGKLPSALVPQVYAALEAHAPGWIAAILKEAIRLFC